MKRLSKMLLLATVSMGITGCAALCDGVISVETDIRNCVLAQKAWGHWSWCYDGLPYPYHFAKGFKDGYRNILSGGSGCQPTLPPQCYWKPEFQGAEGRCKINAWFDGFSHGALAANQDGYGSSGEIPISPTARANLERARRRPVADAFYSNGSNGTGNSIEFNSSQQIQPPTGTQSELQPAPSSDGESSIQLRPYE